MIANKTANKTDTAQILAFVGKEADVNGGRNGLRPDVAKAAIQKEKDVVRPITSSEPVTQTFNAFTGHQMPSGLEYVKKGHGLFASAVQPLADRRGTPDLFKPPC
jgi:hypothetical protein